MKSRHALLALLALLPCVPLLVLRVVRRRTLFGQRLLELFAQLLEFPRQRFLASGQFLRRR